MKVTLMEMKPDAPDHVMKPFIPERSLFIVFLMILTIKRNFYPKQQK